MGIWLQGLLHAEKITDKYGFNFASTEGLKLSPDEWHLDFIKGMIDYFNNEIERGSYRQFEKIDKRKIFKTQK